MTASAHALLTSSVEPNWRTPDWLRAALRREFAIGLDAAADADSAICPTWLGPQGVLADGLSPDLPWHVAAQLGAERPWGQQLPAVFCNPPYSRRAHLPIAPWIRRMAHEGQQGLVIGLLPFAPQTRLWRTCIAGGPCRATEIRRFPFRVKFDPPPGYQATARDGVTHGANVNTVVVIWRPMAEYAALPWAPFERYWVPAEYPRADQYTAADEDGENINGDR